MRAWDSVGDYPIRMHPTHEQRRRLSGLCPIQIAVDTRFTEPILQDQVLDAYSCSPLLAQRGDLGRREGMLPAEAYAPRQGFLNAFHLPLRPQLCLKLGNRTQHIEEQAS